MSSPSPSCRRRSGRKWPLIRVAWPALPWYRKLKGCCGQADSWRFAWFQRMRVSRSSAIGRRESISLNMWFQQPLRRSNRQPKHSERVSWVDPPYADQPFELVSSGDHPPIHIPDGPCDPVGFIGKQESDRVCDILDGPDTPDWMKRVERSQRGIQLFWVYEGLIDGGLDHCGTCQLI